MSFDYSTLITDRAVSDSDTLKALLGKPPADWTEAERTAFNTAVPKGSYDYTDLNRVDECLEDLVARLGRMGYAVPGYQRVKLPRETKPASRLPEGYMEVQYIQSNGTQYVDTGVKVNKADAYKLVLTAHLTSNDNYAGCNGYMQFQAKIGNGQKSKITVEYANVTETISVNDVEISSTSWASYDGQNVKLGLLKMGDTNDSWFSGSPQAGKLYSCQVYSGESLIHDYVPCISPAGAVGLYDLVDGKFYGNSGTGIFFAGPRKVSLPSGYTQLEYIQSSNTQYINSGVIPNQDTQIVYDCERTAALTQERFFGVRTGSTATDGFYFYIYNSKWRYIYNNATIIGPEATTGRYLIDANKNIATINGTSTLTGTYGAFTSAMPALLFAARSAPSDMLRGTHKLFSCIIRQNGVLTRDYIPCSNPSGVLGLYDLVEAKFYPNEGTGSFTAGEAVTWPDGPEEPADDRDPYTWYESDVPTVPSLAQYRGNVAAVRAVLTLPEGTPEPPGSMAQLTTAGANSIEAVLLAVDLILNHIPAAVRHCGVTVCGSKGVMA